MNHPMKTRNTSKQMALLAVTALLLLCSSCSPQLYGKGYRKARRGCDCQRLKIISSAEADRSLGIPAPLYALDTAPIHSSRM